jgi:hypothetical protein
LLRCRRRVGSARDRNAASGSTALASVSGRISSIARYSATEPWCLSQHDALAGLPSNPATFATAVLRDVAYTDTGTVVQTVSATVGIAWQAWGPILLFGVPLFLLVEVEKTVLPRRDSRSGQR